MKIEYDPDIPVSIRPNIKEVIKESVVAPCAVCGCDEIYVSLGLKGHLDVKCYDCGNSFFELELEVDEETHEVASA